MLHTVTEAWRTISPPDGDRHGPLHPLLLLLTVVTGLVDAFSYLVLGHVFVANMTGNVVFLAFALAGASGFSLAASALALLAFAAGALLSGRIVTHLGPRRGPHPGRHGFGGGGSHRHRGGRGLDRDRPGRGRDPISPGRPARHRGRTAERHGQEAGRSRPHHHGADPDHCWGRVREPARWRGRLAFGRRGLAAVAMFVGALIGALTERNVSQPLGLLLALVLLAVVAVSAAHLARGRPVWDRPT